MRCGTLSRVTGALLVAVAAAGLTGCTRQVAGPSLVLRLATPDRQVDATGPQVVHFAAEVARLSGGTIRIDPVWDVTPDGTHDWDQTVARGVAGGTWDMGLVPGRAWDVLGVDSLRALNTPFLVTSEAALRSVLDSDLRGELLAGLPEAGVTGLDLFPDQLRHPFAYEHALRGPDDYAGTAIRAPTSDTVAAVFAALGATTSDRGPDVGTQRGEESQYSLAQGHIATGNVTFYPKTDTLVMRTGVRQRVRDDQWSVLRHAAATTRDWLFDRQPSEKARAAAFCDQGGSIVEATPSQLSSLRQRVGPAVARLRRDPATRHLIGAIGDLVAGIAGEPSLTSCPNRADTADGAQLRSLNGTYITTVTEQQLRDAGERDPNKLRENSGHITWVLDSGRWTYHQEADHYIARANDSGRYTYRDGLFTFYWDAGPGDWTKARLLVDRGGSIQFRNVVDGHADNQNLSRGYFRSWTRVGGLPS